MVYSVQVTQFSQITVILLSISLVIAHQSHLSKFSIFQFDWHVRNFPLLLPVKFASCLYYSNYVLHFTSIITTTWNITLWKLYMFYNRHFLCGFCLQKFRHNSSYLCEILKPILQRVLGKFSEFIWVNYISSQNLKGLIKLHQEYFSVQIFDIAWMFCILRSDEKFSQFFLAL